MNPYQSPNEEVVQAELVSQKTSSWEWAWRVFIVILVLLVADGIRMMFQLFS